MAVNTHDERDNDTDLEELLIKAEPDLQKEVNNKAAFLQQKLKELMLEKEKVIENQKELDKYQENVQKLEKELNELKRKLENEVTERCKAEYLVEQNHKKLKEKDQILAEKFNEVETYKNEVKGLHEQLGELKSKLDSDVKAQESLEEFMTEEVREKIKEIEEYQNEVKKLKNDLDQIKDKLHTETALRYALEIAEEEHKVNISKEKETINNLNKIIQKLNIENKHFEEEFSKLKMKHGNEIVSRSLIEEAIELMKREVSGYKDQIAEKNKIIEQYQIENKKHENEVLVLKEKINHINEKENETMGKCKKLEEIQGENKTLKNDILALTEKYNNEVAVHNLTQDTVKILEEQITKIENKMIEQNSLVENYQINTKTLENELIETKRKLDHEASVRLKLETTVVDNEANKTESEEFENFELITVKEKLENCLLEKISLEKKLSETEENVLELTFKIQSNQTFVEQIQLELTEAREEITKKTENVNRLLKQLSEIETEVQSGLSLIQEKNEELNDIKDIKVKLENDLLAANEQIVIMKTKYENSQRELLAAFEGNEKSQEMTVENMELKEKLTEIQQQFDIHKAQFQKKYQADIHNLKANFEKLNEDKSNEISQLRNANEQLEEQLALKNNVVNELSTNLNQIEKDSHLIIKDLQEKLISKENEMVSNINNYNEEIRLLSENLNVVESEKSKLETEIIRLTNISERYSNKEMENEALKSEISDLRKETQNYIVKIDKLTSKLKENDLVQNQINSDKIEYEKTLNELVQLKYLHEKIVKKHQNLLEKSLIQKNNLKDLKSALRLLSDFTKQMNLELKEDLNSTKLNCVKACNLVYNIKDKQSNDFINETEKKHYIKVKSLESELNNRISNHRLLNEECESLRTLNAKMNIQVNELTQEIDELNLRLEGMDDTNDEVNQLKEDNKNLKIKLSELEDTHTQKLKTLIMDFQAQLEKKDEDYRTLENSQFGKFYPCK